MDQLSFLRTIKKIAITSIFADLQLYDTLVLKGGNLLDLAYELSGRSSIDVDLSIAEDFSNISDVEGRIEKVLTSGFGANGYYVFDFNFREVPPKISDDMKDFWGGYKIDFKIIDVEKRDAFDGNLDQLRRNAIKIGNNQSKKFKIDISRHEYCDQKEGFVLDGQRIFGYSPRVFVAEKIRAICQQMREYAQVMKSNPSPRARDFVDIHIISNHYAISWPAEEFQSTVRRVFEKKRVPTNLIAEVCHTRDFHAEGFPSVQATVLPDFRLEEFQFYFDFVCHRCDDLKPIWNE